jgi:hypothetical protein
MQRVGKIPRRLSKSTSILRFIITRYAKFKAFTEHSFVNQV